MSINREIFLQEIIDWDKNARFYSHDAVMPFQHVIRQEVEQVYELKENEFVLDAGCGTHKISDNTIGVDFSFEMLRRAKENNQSGKYVLCSVHQLPFKAGIFDKIVCNGLLHHVKVQGLFEECLNNFHCVLKKTGHLCIFDRSGNFIPNFFMMLRQPLKLIYKSKSQCCTRNETEFTEDDVRKIVECGFFMEMRDYIVTLPFQFMIIATNVTHYILGAFVARKLQLCTKAIGLFLEKYMSFRWLCAEQCLRLRKIESEDYGKQC